MRGSHGVIRRKQEKVNWFLLIMAMMTSPHSGQIIMRSDMQFRTEESCQQHLQQLKPHAAEIVKSLLPAGSEFRDPQLQCKEDLGTPA